MFYNQLPKMIENIKILCQRGDQNTEQLLQRLLTKLILLPQQLSGVHKDVKEGHKEVTEGIKEVHKDVKEVKQLLESGNPYLTKTFAISPLVDIVQSKKNLNNGTLGFKV